MKIYGADYKITEGYDVVVCGGGPAGIAAAITASRKGAKTLLIERNGCLGGIWTAGLLPWILDVKNKGGEGLLGEILKELEEIGAGRFIKENRTYSCDAEEMKHYLEQKCIREGVDIRLHTMVIGAIVDEKENVEVAITASKSGVEYFKGKAFVDATGDGDLCAFSGCNYEVGNEKGETQPMSLIALLCGIEKKEIERMNNSMLIEGNNPKKNLLNEMKEAGVVPTYSEPTLMQLTDDGIFALMANHEYGFSFHDAKDLTQATIEARDEIYRMIKALREKGGIWKNVRLIATAEQIGVREGRRVEGVYKLTKEDVYQGSVFEDAVCTVGGVIDIHLPTANLGGGVFESEKKSRPYQIPERALMSKDKTNLFMAGRCISGDFLAHSNYRLSGNAVMTGSAAGRLAAVAAQTAGE